MSHHSSNQNPAMTEAMKKIFGEYPNGRLNADDAGALPVAISNENGVVKMEFPKPVAWIGFTGDQAMEMAMLYMPYPRSVR